MSPVATINSNTVSKDQSPLDSIQDMKDVLQEEAFYDKEVYPPITYQHFDEDLPLEKVYGSELRAMPQLLEDEAKIAGLVERWMKEFNVLMSKINSSVSSEEELGWAKLAFSQPCDVERPSCRFVRSTFVHWIEQD